MDASRGGLPESRAPVTSSDELGVLSERFNEMIEGLRERDFIRQTFGRLRPRQDRGAAAGQQGGGSAASDHRDHPLPRHRGLHRHFGKPLAATGARNAQRLLRRRHRGDPRHGGVVNQFHGDAMLVTYNVPVADPHHADNAVARPWRSRGPSPRRHSPEPGFASASASTPAGWWPAPWAARSAQLYRLRRHGEPGGAAGGSEQGAGIPRSRLGVDGGGAARLVSAQAEGPGDGPRETAPGGAVRAGHLGLSRRRRAAPRSAGAAPDALTPPPGRRRLACGPDRAKVRTDWPALFPR